MATKLLSDASQKLLPGGPAKALPNRRAVSIQTLVAVTGYSETAIRRLLKAGGTSFEQGRSERGRPTQLYVVDGLPADIRAACLEAQLTEIGGGGQDPSTSDPEMPMDSPPDPEASCLPTRRGGWRRDALGLRLNESCVPLTSGGAVDEAALLAMGRTTSLQQYHRCLRAVLDLEHELALALYGDKAAALRQVALKHEINWHTLRRWHLKYRTVGAEALVPQWGKREGQNSIPKPLRRELLAMALAPTQENKTQLHAYAVRWSVINGYRAPSPWAVSRFLDKHSTPLLATACRKGKKAHDRKNRFHVDRDPKKLRVNSLWCGDNRLCDTIVRSPDNRFIRPWLIARIDVGSGRWVGWVIRVRPTSDAVAATFRNGVLGFTERALDGTPIVFEPCGLPEHLLDDNGKDYTGGAMRNAPGVYCDPDAEDFRLPSDAADTIEALGVKRLSDDAAATIVSAFGITVHHAIPYSAWSKPIESFFRSYTQTIENEIPGFCGRNAQEKPEILAKLIEKGCILSIEQYRSVIAGLFADWNAHHSVGERGRPPLDFYKDYCPRIPDAEQLDTCLLRPPVRHKLTQHGFVISGLGKFMSPDPDLVILTGLAFDIRHSLDDPSKVHAFLPQTGQRFVVPRVPDDPDPWGMIYGRAPGPGFKFAQEVRSAQSEVVGQANRAVARTINPELADRTGAWHAAAANAALLKKFGGKLRRDVKKLLEGKDPRFLPAIEEARAAALAKEAANSGLSSDPERAASRSASVDSAELGPFARGNDRWLARAAAREALVQEGEDGRCCDALADYYANYKEDKDPLGLSKGHLSDCGAATVARLREEQAEKERGVCVGDPSRPAGTPNLKPEDGKESVHG